MVLTGNEIYKEIQNKNITIDPFRLEQLNPNSYDLCLGDQITFYDDGVILDVYKKNKLNKVNLDEDGYVLKKNKLYIAESLEKINVKNAVPRLHSKSGIARLGLFVHITADLLSVGHNGKVTFQLYPSLDVKVYKGLRIGQVSFWMVQ